MSSRPLPNDLNDRAALATWISEGIDENRPRVVGRGWKHLILGGASVHKLMTDTPTQVVYHIRVATTEAMILAKVIASSPLSRNAWIRRAIAHWLIRHEGVDPESIPNLAKHL